MAASGLKESGAQGRKRRKAVTAEGAQQHRARLRSKGLIDKEIEPCGQAEFGHLWTMRRLLDLYVEVELDAFMTLADKVRHLTNISSSIAKVNLQADMERRVLELQARDQERVRKFQELKDRYELELKLQTGADPDGAAESAGAG